jgi:hypothetical protein
MVPILVDLFVVVEADTVIDRGPTTVTNEAANVDTTTWEGSSEVSCLV